MIFYKHQKNSFKFAKQRYYAYVISTVSPYTIDVAAQIFFKIASKYYSQVRPYIESRIKEIKAKQIPTTFYPKEFKVDVDNNVANVTDAFMTWFGGQKPPIEQTKTFLVDWKTRPKGTLLTTCFEERASS